MTVRSKSEGVLYVVATPIGNLEDITLRAIRVLGEVDLIACEDTRHTAKLLAAHSIATRLISYFEHNEERRTPELIKRLESGDRIALVTDAGTPTVSDPGYRLVRAALEARMRVVSVPGASAVTAAISIAGLPTDRFAFEGFLPQRAAARDRVLASLATEPRTMIFFEAARRLGETLRAMAHHFGVDREAAVIRELSKVFEEVTRAPLEKLVSDFTATQPRGEITIIVEGSRKATSGHNAASITVDELVSAGMGLKQASAIVARLGGSSRRELYQRALEARRASPKD